MGKYSDAQRGMEGVLSDFDLINEGGIVIWIQKRKESFLPEKKIGG